MVHVLLDANAIGIDPPLGKIEHRVILDAHRSGAIVLIVPQLALREAVAGWKRELASQIGKLRSASQRLAKLAPSYEWNVPAPSINQVAEDLLAELSLALDAAGVERPETPKADHEDLIDRAINRRQPFDQGGGGYRDALLWHITRDCADKGNEVLLVSDDPKAFAQDRERRGPLASTLNDEVTGGGSVRLVSSMKEAIADLGLVAPEALVAAEAVIERLGASFGSQLLERLTMELMHPVHTWITRDLINPFIASSASLGVPHVLLGTTVEEARTSEKGVLEASILLKVRQWLTIRVPIASLSRFQEIGQINPSDENRGEVEIDAIVDHRCRVVLDSMTDQITSAEVVETVAASPAAQDATVRTSPE